MNYRYSEPEGKPTLAPVNPYRNETREKSSYLKFKTNNPPLIYDGKLKLEVGKVYQGEMFVKQWQRQISDTWHTINDNNIINGELSSYIKKCFETRQVLTDAEMLDTSAKEGERDYIEWVHELTALGYDQDIHFKPEDHQFLVSEFQSGRPLITTIERYKLISKADYKTCCEVTAPVNQEDRELVKPYIELYDMTYNHTKVLLEFQDDAFCVGTEGGTYHIDKHTVTDWMVKNLKKSGYIISKK